MAPDNEYAAALRKAVVAHGDEVGIDSPECAEHRKTHEDCVGCQYLLGCSKLVALQLLSLSRPGPDSVDRILKAATREEVLAVVNDCELPEFYEPV